MNEVVGQASLQQEPLWFLHRLDPSDAAYNIAFSLSLTGELDIDRLIEAITLVVGAHDSLRTSFPSRFGRVVRIVDPEPRVRFDRAPPLEGKKQQDGWRQRLVDAPFALERPPLHRFGLLERGERAFELVAVFHHIVFDGESVRVFLRDLERAYAGDRLAPPPGSFDQFVARQREKSGLQDLSGLVERLEGAEPASLLPDRDEGLAPAGQVARMPLPTALWSEVRRFAFESGLTPFMVALGALDVVLARYSGVRKLAVGTAASLRMDPQIREHIGLFVNTLAIPAHVDESESFLTLLQSVKEACLDFYRRHRVPFVELVEAVSPSRVEGRNPLFSVMLLLYEDEPIEPPRLGALDARYAELAPSASKFDLTVTLAPAPDGPGELALEYRSDCFSEGLVERFGEALVQALDALVRRPEASMGALGRISPEALRALEVWETGAPSPDGPLVPRAIRERAEAEPEHTVAWEADRPVTRRQLAARVERMAAALATRVDPGCFVGLVLRPSIDGLVAMLGCFASGRPFVPLDPDLPFRWRAQLAEGVGPKLFVCAEDVPASEHAPRVSVRELLAEGEGRPAPPMPGPDAIAYVLYTSGSTGRSKGVEVDHASLSRFMHGFARGVPLPDGAVWAALSVLGFDITMLEQLYPLMFGGAVRHAPDEVLRDPQRLGGWLDQRQPTVVQVTPTRWRSLLSGGFTGYAHLVALTGGEILTAGLARSLLRRGERLVNLYGPTEGTVWWTAHEVERSRLESLPDSVALPIGQPLPGAALLLLDADERRVPLGAPGWIGLSGPQISNGYHGEPDWTDRLFGPSPVVGGRRLYRTGDRAVRRVDGSLVFLGRRDDQVKVRGHRVELGSVEAALRSVPGVTEAAAIHVAGELHGFVSSDRRTSSAELRRMLEAAVPAPMVPSSVSVLETMPRTPSGKIDRTRLRPPHAVDGQPAEDPPIDPLELQMSALWAAALGRSEPVARSADFFELGGQSILAVELAAQLERALGTRITTVDILRARTVARLAERVRGGGRGDGFYALVGHRVAGSAAPIFTVGASAMGHELLPYLDPEIPVYSLSPFGLVDKPGLAERWTDPSVGSADGRAAIRELAAAFLSEVRRVQPRGPYRIIGYCGDVRLALEMAWQVLEDGEGISFFGAIDVTDATGFLDKLRPSLGLLADYGLAYPRWVVERRRQLMQTDLRRRSAQLAARIDRLARRPSSRHTLEQLFYARYARALRSARRPPLEGPVTLFVSTEFLRRTTRERLCRLGSGPVEVVEVRGLHEALLRPPHLAGLGRALDQALRPTNR